MERRRALDVLEAALVEGRAAPRGGVGTRVYLRRGRVSSLGPVPGLSKALRESRRARGARRPDFEGVVAGSAVGVARGSAPSRRSLLSKPAAALIPTICLGRTVPVFLRAQILRASRRIPSLVLVSWRLVVCHPEGPFCSSRGSCRPVARAFLLPANCARGAT